MTMQAFNQAWLLIKEEFDDWRLISSIGRGRPGMNDSGYTTYSLYNPEGTRAGRYKVERGTDPLEAIESLRVRAEDGTPPQHAIEDAEDLALTIRNVDPNETLTSVGGITHALTHDRFRGQGLYSRAVLPAMLSDQGQMVSLPGSRSEYADRSHARFKDNFYDNWIPSEALDREGGLLVPLFAEQEDWRSDMQAELARLDRALRGSRGEIGAGPDNDPSEVIQDDAIDHLLAQDKSFYGDGVDYYVDNGGDLDTEGLQTMTWDEFLQEFTGNPNIGEERRQGVEDVMTRFFREPGYARKNPWDIREIQQQVDRSLRIPEMQAYGPPMHITPSWLD